MTQTFSSGSFKVFTYKAGLLSRLAHDLRLSLARFEINVDGDNISAKFWPESLSVDGAVKKGRVDPNTPGPSDKQKIHGNITEKILHTARHPEITFTGTGASTGKVKGDLTLHGRTQAIEMRVRQAGSGYKGEVELVPTRWGIPPFKAVGGAIKLQDKVRIEFEVS